MAGNKTKYGPGSSNDITFSARKNSAGTISKGEPVYATGFHADGYFLVEKAKADSASTMPSKGVAETDFSDTETGSLLISGVLRDADTSSWSVGDELFVSAATAGVLTNTKPSATTDVVEKVGVVISSHASTGVIQIYNAGAAVHANRAGGDFHTVASSSQDGFLPQSHTSATAIPTINDDTSQGFKVGSRWINVSTDKEYVCVDNTDGAAVWKETTIGDSKQFFADQLDNPNNSDWAVNALAPASADSNNAALITRRFDDTTEEGVGFILEIPSGVTNIVIALRSRAETGSASNLDVVPKLYCREMPDNAAVESWTAGTDLTTITMGTSNEYFQYDSQSIALSTLSLVAGRVVQFELTRNTGAGGDTLSGDWTLLEIKVSFT